MSGDAGLWLRNQFYNRVVGSLLPLSWFAPKAPRPNDLSVAASPIQLQIVSHCWNYAHLSLFQLSSLVNYPPKDCQLTYTLFYAEEDEGMKNLVARFSQMDIPNITWDWQVLPKTGLFRRGLGRQKSPPARPRGWGWVFGRGLFFP